MHLGFVLENDDDKDNSQFSPTIQDAITAVAGLL